MRSRSLREGSVGLLLLLGLISFGALLLWLRGLTFGNRSYQFVVQFKDAGGMQIGAPVRYRGVAIGRIINIQPSANGVDVTLEISPAELKIPRDVAIETNQSGLIGETSIDITPKTRLENEANLAYPLDPNCNPNIIICNRSRLQGKSGVSFAELMRSTVEFTQRFSNPIFLENINSVVKNTASATEGITQLTKELSALSQSVREELKKFSSTASTLANTANRVGNSVEIATNQVNFSLGRVTNKIEELSDKFGATADEFGTTAVKIRDSASQFNRVAGNINGLIAANRATFINTLDNLNQTSLQLRSVVGSLSPIINQVEQGELLQNLEMLSANAAAASARFRALSEGEFIRNLELASANAVKTTDNLRALSEPSTLVTLQQTLDSARAVFKNAEKITSDIDELTGDPSFRNNLRRLINGLSGLVSSTQQLQQQVEVAQTLAPYVDAFASSRASETETLQISQSQPEFKKQLNIPPTFFSAPLPAAKLQSLSSSPVPSESPSSQSLPSPNPN